MIGQSGGGDRLLAIYDEDRFELIGSQELDHINTTGNARAPLVLHLRDRISQEQFLLHGQPPLPQQRRPAPHPGPVAQPLGRRPNPTHHRRRRLQLRLGRRQRLCRPRPSATTTSPPTAASPGSARRTAHHPVLRLALRLSTASSTSPSPPAPPGTGRHAPSSSPRPTTSPTTAPPAITGLAHPDLARHRYPHHDYRR